MKLTEIFKKDELTLSFEVFPPKTFETFDSIKSSVLEIAKLSPSYMSVTYGAGGGNAVFSMDIAKTVKNSGVETLEHLTCVNATREQIRERLFELKNAGIENILALRGDLPAGQDLSCCTDFKHASDLAKEIADFGGFCVGGACYPESHPESADSFSDIENLKKKVDAGCEFLTTQMFFDNNIYYNFLYRLYKAGIDVPVIPGIMPVTNPASILRICKISGTALPQRFLRIVDKFKDNKEALTQAGIAFATEQIIDLYANGVNAVHVYSMNKPDVARRIKENLSDILG